MGETIEEKMSKCVVYNLTILSYAIKPSEQTKQFITDGLFIKSNTNAFIHVTYYLFNILDQKEFRRKFYWPIIDKKTENSYRTNSVEFINMLIDRYSLNHDKVKQVTVVHPSGKKFMSLMLDIIATAVKDVMKRRNYSCEVSLDAVKTDQVICTLSKIENDIMGNIKAEQKMIRDKTAEIQDLINTIYPNDGNAVPFEEFIENWHTLNKSRLVSLKTKNAKVKDIFKKSDLLQEKAHKMLSNKKYEIIQPTSNEIKELADFYQHVEIPVENELNIVSLILYLQSTLSVIQNYIKNFSYDEVEISDEEMMVVKRKLVELQHFEPLIMKLAEKENKLKEKIAKLHKEKEESMIQDESQNEEDKITKEIQGKEALRTLLSPRYHFDPSRNSMNCFNMKKKVLAIEIGADGTSNVDHTLLNLSQSKLYRPLSDSALNKSREMAPPKQFIKPPSRRRQRDPMQLMEQAFTSTNKNRHDLNSTTSFNLINPRITSSTPLSSTMLSPDLIHHAHSANFSMISNISSITNTPLSSTHFNKVVASNITVQQNYKFENIPKPDVLHSGVKNEETIQLKDQDQKRKLQKSPVTKADTLVSLEETFGDRRPLAHVNSMTLPKIQLNDDTLSNNSSNGFLSENEQKTVCEKENFGDEINTDTILCVKTELEEDLFNVSDSVLVNDF